MRKILAGLALLCALTAVQAAEPFAQERIDWNKPWAPFRIIGNIYYVGTDDLAVYLIKTSRGLILLDSGLPESVPQIEKNIETLGFRLKDIRIILLGHAHFDHAGGLAQLKKDTGAMVLVSPKDKEIVERGYITFGPSASIHFPPVKVDQDVVDGMGLRYGGVDLKAHLTPGHTPGCTSWTMAVTENGVPHEVLFACSITVAGNPLVNNSDYPQIVSDYRKSFTTLQAIKADVLLAEHARVFDAHGKAMRIGQGAPNPFIDAGEAQRVVAASERDFEAELARQQAVAKP
jgi:metallo-beta-lactamase class B